MDQVLQIAGAILILIGYGLGQMGRLDPHSRPYLLMNLAGSATLAILAAVDRHLGFLLLYGIWVTISLLALIRMEISGQSKAVRR